MKKLYTIDYPGENTKFIFAKDYFDAVEKWKKSVAKEWEKKPEEINEPDSIRFISDEVIE